MSATAVPASGLTSSRTDRWPAPAPTPVNHDVGAGAGQLTAAGADRPKRAAPRPGADESSPTTATGPSPPSAVATVPDSISTSWPRPPRPTRTGPETPSAELVTATSPAPAIADGQARVARVSVVRVGGCSSAGASGGRTSTRAA